MSTSKSDSHLAHSGGERAGVATRRWVSHRSATPNPPRCHRREPRVQTRVNLCSICAPGACCAAVSCGFLWFPAVASCGLVTLAARHLLCAACGRAVCYVARVSTVYGSRGYGVRSFCATVPSRIGGTILFAAAWISISTSVHRSRRPGEGDGADAPRLQPTKPATTNPSTTCADLGGPAKGLLLLHSSAVSVGLCRDAPRGRPMCYEDEGALTSIEEVNVRACPKKGFSRNMSATSTLLSWALGGGRAAPQPSTRAMTKTLVVWDFDWCACSAHSRHGAAPSATRCPA